MFASGLFGIPHFLFGCPIKFLEDFDLDGFTVRARQFQITSRRYPAVGAGSNLRVTSPSGKLIEVGLVAE